MKEKMKHQKKRWQNFGRLFTFTYISLVVIGWSGIFSLAHDSFKSTVSSVKVNYFLPKTYTDIEIQEPNGQDYIIEDNDSSVQNDTGKDKEVYFTNPNANTKDEFVRARIIAVVRNKDGTGSGEIVEFDCGSIATLPNDNLSEKTWYQLGDYYYYSSPIAPGESTKDLFSTLVITKPSVESLQLNEQTIDFNIIVDTIETSKQADEYDYSKLTDAWGSEIANKLQNITS